MTERCHREPFGRDRLVVDAADGAVADPVDRPVVARLDRAEHRLAGRVTTKESEDAEGLLGRQGEVVGDAHRWGTAAFEEPGEVLPRHEPLVLGTAVGDQERPAGVPSGGEGLFDLGAVLVVVAGEPAQVLLGQPDESGGLGQRELVAAVAHGPQVLGGDPGVSRVCAAFEFAGSNPPGPVRVDHGCQVGTSRLRERAGHRTSGRRNGRSRGRSNRRRRLLLLLNGRSNGRTVVRCRGGRGAVRRGEGAERDGGAHIEHPFDLPVRHPEHRGGVRNVEELLAVCGDTGVGACPEGRAAPGRALGGDEPLVGVGVAASEHGSEVLPPNLTSQSEAGSGATQPTSRFLAAVRVVPLRATSARGPTGPGGRGLGMGLEVADDRVDDAGRVGPATAERGDRELHRELRTGGPTGFPEGNLSMCAGRICCSTPMNGTGTEAVPGEPFRRVKLTARPRVRHRWWIDWRCSGSGRGVR